MSKKCNKCNIEKHVGKMRNKYLCIECDKKWHAENYKRNREKILAKNAIWRKTHPERVSYHARQALLRKYNITQQHYDALLAAQDSKCAVCRSTDTGRRISQLFLVDHRHRDGKVRGLLCHKCNAAIGLLKENIEIIQNVIAYLTKG